jgi:thiol-disulfide isomerase/thioredoxin
MYQRIINRIGFAVPALLCSLLSFGQPGHSTNTSPAATQAVSSGSAGRQETAFRTYPDAFAQGESIRVLYRPQLAGHNDSAGVRASVYLFRNFTWEGYDLPIKKTDSGWISSYAVPDGAALLAFHFLIGDSIDKGARFPYAAMVHDKAGKMAEGSYMEWGLMRNKEKSGMPSGIVPAASLIEPNVTMIWVPKEWSNPAVVSNLFPGMARAIVAAYPGKADSILRKMSSYLLRQPDLTERQYIYIRRVYGDILRDKNKADSLQSAIIAKFPGGLMDRLHRLEAIYMHRDTTEKAAIRTAFFRDFPLDKYPFDDYLDPEAGDMSLAGHVYVEMAMRAFINHDWDGLSQLIKHSPFQYLDYIYQHDVMYPFRTDKPSITKQEALDISTVIVDELLRRVKDNDPRISGRQFVAPAEWLQHVMTVDSGIFGYHLGLMYEQGDAQKGYALAEQLEPYIGVSDIPFNENYVRLLHKVGKDAKAIPFIKKAVFANTATPEMLTLLEEDYRRTDGKTGSFLNYYQSLRSQAAVEKEHARLDKEMITVPGLSFRLSDMNGQTIDLAALKGKIVVLDFWATWCFPCKAAMPGMQMAVNKYKQDPSVAFYFISTLEERPDYKKNITSFLKEKNYDFNVLLDDKEDTVTKRGGALFGRWAPVLKMNGIPQKVIIDQDGIVRWVTSGFYGNVIQVADEVSYVIDQLKKPRS